MAQLKVYIIGSLRNVEIPVVGNALRAAGFYAFDDWYGAGPDADDKWQEYEKLRGRTYREAVYGEAAGNTFNFDKAHLDTSDAAVLVMPAGKSAHLELGYMAGRGKPTFIYFPEGEPERFDVMTRFATDLCFQLVDVVHAIRRLKT